MLPNRLHRRKERAGWGRSYRTGATGLLAGGGILPPQDGAAPEQRQAVQGPEGGGVRGQHCAVDGQVGGDPHPRLCFETHGGEGDSAHPPNQAWDPPPPGTSPNIRPPKGITNSFPSRSNNHSRESSLGSTHGRSPKFFLKKRRSPPPLVLPGCQCSSAWGGAGVGRRETDPACHVGRVIAERGDVNEGGVRPSASVLG